METGFPVRALQALPVEVGEASLAKAARSKPRLRRGDAGARNSGLCELTKEAMMNILKGHVSPETAFVVDDYPYGFRLRCKIRYWLEYAPKRGVRFVSQTSNPKRGNVWNKPKASTYCRFGGCMVLDEQGHVKWSGLSEYCTGAD